MKSKAIASIYLLLLLTTGFPQIINADIQYVSVNDSSIFKSIDFIIEQESKRDSIFAEGFGYFMFYYDGKVAHGNGEFPNRVDTLYSFDVMIAYGNPKEDVIINYPIYFHQYSDRVLAFYPNEVTEDYIHFSESSKELYHHFIGKNIFEGYEGIEGSVKLGYYYSIRKTRNVSKSVLFTNPLVVKVNNIK